MEKKNNWIIPVGVIVFAVIVLVALYVPSPLNNKDNQAGPQNEDKNKMTDPTKFTSYDEAYNYLNANPEASSDFVLYFDKEQIDNSKLNEYFGYFDENKYTYTVSGYSPYVDEKIRTAMPDYNFNYDGFTGNNNWFDELNSYGDTLRSDYQKYITDKNLTDLDPNAFETLRPGQITVTTTNKALLDFINKYPNLGFGFYSDTNMNQSPFYRK